MVRTNEIKAQMKRKGMTQEKLAEKLNINPSTLNRKINNVEGENLTVREATLIVSVLQIPPELIENIFFAKELA